MVQRHLTLKLIFFSSSILFTKLIAAKDIYDHTTKYANTKVVVHEAVADGDRWPDQMEIVCPDVVDPGTFFLCHADIPRGTSLMANITIVDDIDPSNSETTGWIDIPDAVHSLPGILPQQFSYNGTFDVAPDLSTFAFVLKQTYFESIYNISHIEFVPIGVGEFTIEVVAPVCDSGYIWCSLTHSCATSCGGVMFENATSVFGQYTCGTGDPTDQPFCSNEETCHINLECPGRKPG